MAVMTCYYKSEYVGFEIPFTLILPEKKQVRCEASPQYQEAVFEKNSPVLYLLHDEAEGREEWMNMTGLCRCVQEYGLAVVLPDCHRSFYSDYVIRDGNSGENDSNIEALQNFTELMYESYITKELVPYVQKMFPVSSRKEDTFIGGKGMGGFGALKLGLNHPDQFGGLFSISGLMDLQWAMDHMEEKKEQFQEIFGDLKVKPGSKEDFASILERRAEHGTWQNMYFVFNQDHIYEQSNKRWLDSVKNYLKQDVILQLEEPKLDWKYIDRKMEDIFKWIRNCLR